MKIELSEIKWNVHFQGFCELLEEYTALAARREAEALQSGNTGSVPAINPANEPQTKTAPRVRARRAGTAKEKPCTV